MPKSLADGHTKLTLLTTEPAAPENPLATELNGGEDGSCNVLSSDFLWSPTDSDKVAEKALCDFNNANALGASNFQGGLTIFRYFDAATGAVDPAEDTIFELCKVKGTRLWGYARRNGKDYSEPWADGDEIFLGLEFLTDEAQSPQDLAGYIKYRVPLEPQRGWPFTAVAAP